MRYTAVEGSYLFRKLSDEIDLTRRASQRCRYFAAFTVFAWLNNYVAGTDNVVSIIFEWY